MSRITLLQLFRYTRDEQKNRKQWLITEWKTTIKSLKKNWEENQLTKEIAHVMTWTRLKSENLKKESESLLIAALNNAIRLNCVKTKIDSTEKNNMCWWCRNLLSFSFSGGTSVS